MAIEGEEKEEDDEEESEEETGVLASRGAPKAVVDKVHADALAMLNDVLQEAKGQILNRHIFVGTGQYYHHEEEPLEEDGEDGNGQKAKGDGGELEDEDEDSVQTRQSRYSTVPMSRYVICRLGEDLREVYSAEEITDIALPQGEGHDMLRNALLHFGATSVVHGEVDALNQSGWKYGYFHETTFTLFSMGGDLAQISLHEGKPVIRVVTAASASGAEDGESGESSSNNVLLIDIAKIKDIAVRLEENNCVRKLNVRMQDGSEHTLMHDYVREDEQGTAMIGDPEDDETSEEEKEEARLTLLMISTEWMVKAAGSLVLSLRRLGFTYQLRLPRSLLAEGNPAVRNRNEQWKQRVEKMKGKVDE